MKYILFFTLFSLNTFAQEIQVFSKQDSIEVPFVNISYLINDSIVGGTYTNEEGSAFLEVPQDINFLEFSSMGYITEKIKKDSLCSIIYLSEESIGLTEIVLKARKSTKKRTQSIGYPAKYKNHAFSVSFGFETVTFFENNFNEQKKLSSFLFYLKEPEYANQFSSLFRINFYTNENGYPTNKFYIRKNDKNVFTIKPNQYGKIKLDISNLDISLPKEGLFIGIEYIGLIEDRAKIITKTNEFDKDFERQVGISFLKSKNKNAYHTYIKYKFIENAKDWKNLNKNKSEDFPFLKASEYYVPAFGIEVYE